MVVTTAYPSLLEGEGADGTNAGLVTRDRYGAVFETCGSKVSLPWNARARRKEWSRFWSSYLASTHRVRAITANEAWDFVIPFRWLHASTISGPQDASAKADVLLYPSAVTVVIRVRVDGDWPLGSFAAALAEIRAERSWDRRSDGPHNRSLDGIASDLCREASSAFFDAHVDPGARTLLTVAAPTMGTGSLDSYALDKPTAKSCVARLEALAPTARYDKSRLVDANNDPRRAARLYVGPDGHVIWHPSGFLRPRGSDGVRCLYHNHTYLVAHITALTAIASWAAQQIEAQVPISVAVQPLIHRAEIRLRQLHDGTRETTYRSEVAKRRLESFFPRLNVIKAAL